MSALATAPVLFRPATPTRYLAIATWETIDGESGVRIARVLSFSPELATDIMEAEVLADFGTTRRRQRAEYEHGEESPVYIHNIEVYEDAELDALDVLTDRVLIESAVFDRMGENLND